MDGILKLHNKQHRVHYTHPQLNYKEKAIILISPQTYFNLTL